VAERAAGERRGGGAGRAVDLQLDRLLRACGGRPLAEPEPDPVRAALRNVLGRLLREHDAGFPDEVREMLLLAGTETREPRLARYFLARALSERPGLPYDSEDADAEGRRVRTRAWKEDDGLRAHLGDADPLHPPRLPAGPAGAAVALLALVDVGEAVRFPVDYRGDFTAFNVLRVIVEESRWPGALRGLMRRIARQEDLDDRGLAAGLVRVVAEGTGNTVPSLHEIWSGGEATVSRDDAARPRIGAEEVALSRVEPAPPRPGVRVEGSLESADAGGQGRAGTSAGQGEGLPGESYLPPSAFAAHFGTSLETAKKRLSRWRSKNVTSSGWMEHDRSRPREPRFLYRVADVRHLFGDASR
jgi:hypothetical protein